MLHNEENTRDGGNRILVDVVLINDHYILDNCLLGLIGDNVYVRCVCKGLGLLGDGVYHVHTVYNVAEGSVGAVEARSCISIGDEELAGCGCLFLFLQML